MEVEIMQGKELTKADKQKFLKKLKTANGDVSKACAAIKIARSTAYDHKKSDADFSALWDETIDSIVDSMEAEMYRRAVKGTLKPVYQKGMHIGNIREYSDSLLQFALRGKRPEIYRDKMDINQKVPGSLEVSVEEKIKQVYGDEFDN